MENHLGNIGGGLDGLIRHLAELPPIFYGVVAVLAFVTLVMNYGKRNPAKFVSIFALALYVDMCLMAAVNFPDDVVWRTLIGLVCAAVLTWWFLRDKTGVSNE